MSSQRSVLSRHFVYMHVCPAYLCVNARDHRIQQVGHQRGKGTNPSCGQQNRENENVYNVGQIVTCET